MLYPVELRARFVIVSSKAVPIETEIKLRVAEGGIEALRKGLNLHGFRELRPRTLEVDVLYDRPNDELQSTGRALRLRSTGTEWTLTYKGPPEASPFKSREEIESRVADGRAVQQILAALGYSAGFRYEKYRTVFQREGERGIVTLDETPIGEFMELEGAGEWIDRTTVELGFLRMDYVVDSYPVLYRKYRKQYLDAPRNMTFSS